MTNEDLVREKVTEAFRVLAEALVYLSPSAEIPKLTLWVNDGTSDHTHVPAYDSEIKKIRRWYAATCFARFSRGENKP